MNNVLNVEELFSGRLFVVPDYQRGYAWEQRQWDEFIEDIELLPDGKDHFTGTVVLHEEKDSPLPIDESGKKYAYVNIVDGQQLLTTIVLFLDSLRLEMLSHAKLSTLAAGIVSTYLSIATSWRIFDNARSGRMGLIASGRHTETQRVVRTQLWKEIERKYRR